MHETVLIILAAVVALIVVVVLLGMRYLRAEDEDDFDMDAPARPGPARSRDDDLARERGHGLRGDTLRRMRAEPERQRLGAVRGTADRSGGTARSGGGGLSSRAERGHDVRDGDDVMAARGSRPLDRNGRDPSGTYPGGRSRTPGRDRDDMRATVSSGTRSGRDNPGRDGLRRMDDFAGRQPGQDDMSRRETAVGRDGLDRRSATRAGARSAPRRAGNGHDALEDSLPALRPRPASAAKSAAKGKRDSDGDWPSSEWDELSDVDYWAELASDKPLPASPASQGGRPSPGLADGGRRSRGASQPNGSERSRSEGSRSERSRFEGSRSEPNRSGRGGGSRGDADAGSRRTGRLGGDRFGSADHDALPTSAGRTSDMAHPGLASLIDAAAGSGRSDDFADTGPRRAALPASDRRAADRPAADRSVPASGGRGQVPADDDPLTSPSFPRIEADDSRSYRRSRSASGLPAGRAASDPSPGQRAGHDGQPATARYPSVPAGQSPGGLDSPDQRGANGYYPAAEYAPAPAGTGRSRDAEVSAPRGYPESGTSGYAVAAGPGTGSYPSSAGAVSGGYPVPAAPPEPAMQAPPPAAGYPAAAADSGSYLAPAPGTGGYPSPASGSYLMPPVNGASGVGEDSYSVPRSDSYPARSPAADGYVSGPSGGYPAEPDPRHYLPAAATSQYAVRSGGPGYGTGPVDQAAGHHGYPAASRGPDPHTSPHPASQQPVGNQAGYSANGGDYPYSAAAGFPGQDGGPPGSYPLYPAAVPPATSGVHQAPAGFGSGPAGFTEGFGQDLPVGQAAMAAYTDAAHQPYDPLGYPVPMPGAGGHADADPYAADPYWYSGYGNGGH